MRSRTKWWVKWACLACLMVAPQSVLAQGFSVGPPATETPLPLMWGERDEGFFFAMEAVFMRMNNPLKSQVVAQRGLWDWTGEIRGYGPPRAIFEDDDPTDEIPPTFVTTIPSSSLGVPGQFVGSGAVALTTTDIGGQTFQPGTRMSFGYRLRNGIAIEVNYMSLTAARRTASAGVIGPPGVGVGQDMADSFLSAPFYNYSPFLSGPLRDVISGVDLFLSDGSGGAFVFVPQAPDDLFFFGGYVVPAYGIGNGAEIFEQSFRQRYATGELNFRVPLFQGEVTRTYWTGGFKYIGMQERYRLRIVDFGLSDTNDGSVTQSPEFAMIYTNKITNHFYGMMIGCGSEAYLGLGWAISVEAKVGALAERTRVVTDVKRQDGNYQLKHTSNQINAATNFQAGGYLWWYPIEGIQLRAGYEYSGIVGARRSPNPIDFDLGRLQPEVKATYFSLDGFVAGVAFIF